MVIIIFLGALRDGKKKIGKFDYRSRFVFGEPYLLLQLHFKFDYLKVGK